MSDEQPTFGDVASAIGAVDLKGVAAEASDLLHQIGSGGGDNKLGRFRIPRLPIFQPKPSDPQAPCVPPPAPPPPPVVTDPVMPVPPVVPPENPAPTQPGVPNPVVPSPVLPAPVVPAPIPTPTPPSNPQPPPTDPQLPQPPPTNPAPGGGGFINMTYFTNWSIYARNYTPVKLPVNMLSHVLYAFANCQQDGSVVLTDTWADTDKRFAEYGDTWSDTGNNVYGCFKRLGVIKRASPHIKVLLSIGGWTLSTNFAAVAADANRRKQFTQTALTLMNDLGLDGIDIDWEYPADVSQGNDYLVLMQECRAALNAYAAAKNESSRPYLLTGAFPAGKDKYERLPLGKIAQVIDLFNLMAYDFHGSWDQVTGHQANLYGDSPSCIVAVRDYIAAGVPPSKIVLGMPIYGRSFLNCAENRANSPYTGVGAGTWEPGVYDYKALPLPGSTVMADTSLGVSWCFEPTKREFVSYDTVDVIRTKTAWARQTGLAGVMYWEASGDRDDDQSLIRTAFETAGGAAALERSENHRQFPTSKYDNVKNGFA